jgi:hypothetical protein
MLPYNDDKLPDDLDEPVESRLTANDWIMIIVILAVLSLIAVLTASDFARMFVTTPKPV